MTKRTTQHPPAPCGDCPGCPDGVCTLGKDLANIIATLVRCEKRETDLGAMCLWLAEHNTEIVYREHSLNGYNHWPSSCADVRLAAAREATQ